MKCAFAAIIPPSLADADEILTRYGRWAMDRAAIRKCGSAERDYRPAQNDDDRQPRQELPTTVEAMAAQRALQRVPDRERIVLSIIYIPRKLPIAAQLRIANIPARLCQERHISGLRMFNNLFKIAIQSRNLTPS